MAQTQLPAPREPLDEAPATSGPRHEFVLPPNKEGQAPPLRPGRRRIRERPITPVPTVTGPTASETAQPVSAARLGMFILNPNLTVPVVMAASGTAASGASSAPLLPASAAPLPTVSRFTERNRRRRALEDESGVEKRKYVRKVAFNTCSKCGHPKTAEFGHSRYGNATFCSRSSGMSLDEWLRQQKHPQ